MNSSAPQGSRVQITWWRTSLQSGAVLGTGSLGHPESPPVGCREARHWATGHVNDLGLRIQPWTGVDSGQSGSLSVAPKPWSAISEGGWTDPGADGRRAKNEANRWSFGPPSLKNGTQSSLGGQWPGKAHPSPPSMMVDLCSPAHAADEDRGGYLFQSRRKPPSSPRIGSLSGSGTAAMARKADPCSEGTPRRMS